MERREKIRRYVEKEIREAGKEIEKILEAAEAEPFEDVRLGLIQRATDLAEERETLRDMVRDKPM
ncbi:MAG: hypothetical protein K9L57_07440 [Spirochaetaceae bacterium]|nr:hypothetical protein [Spirochaetia bacterium]MCF7951452.1 hypothetical protein [Spirochaetaceae bacterium]